ncbi:phage tail protein [Escherichia coli]|nr:phage tail protein [Escherichia coli]
MSHHKVQQKLNCQERRQKVQPVMQPGMQRPQQKSPESAEAHSQRNKAG